jgi:ATP-dependent DNA helicase DinG
MTLSEVFNENGLLAHRLPGHEYREGQSTMAEAVMDALQNGKPLAVQAGTGLGKTFAYLVPALLFATGEEKKVVISTATLQLQTQLIKKDIPSLEVVLRDRLSFKIALVKGRNNYLCIRKITAFAQANLQIPLFRDPGDAPIWTKLLDLFYENTLVNGDKDEIPFRIPESLWTEVGAEAELCMRGRCPFYHDCYFYKARQQQKEANLLITNHALFFADLAVRQENAYQEDVESVLASYQAVIFDEAQNTEDYATDHFSSEFSYGRLHHFVLSVRNALRPGGNLQWPDEIDYLRVDGLLEVILRRSTDFLFSLAEKWSDKTTRITANEPLKEPVSPDLFLLSQELKALSEIAASEEQKILLQGYMMRCQLLMAELIQCCSLAELLAYAYWFENPQQGELRSLRLACAPISLADLMGEGLFSRVPVVMTSATLASELLSRMGMVNPRYLRIDSPFQYEQQARLYIPMDGPEPTTTRTDEFHRYVAQQILELVSISKGRAFLLFTSYHSMEEVYQLCNEKLEEWNYLTLKQGDYRREELIKRFSEHGHAVLFAVASFWEGVDIQGEALSLVVLVKLPFAVPTEPILQARMEALQREGLDPFSHYTVPQASLRLKQGFGRLIRSKTDCGVIAVLDKRIRSKTYGRRFLKDLPPAPIIGTMEEVARFFHDIEHGKVLVKKSVSSFDIDEGKILKKKRSSSKK